MLLRVVLFFGVGLILAGFGAAGWQYWQSLPQATAVVAAETAASPMPKALSAPPAALGADDAKAGQTWLISSGGGLVPRKDARNFLAQHKFHENRDLRFQFRAPLTTLLSEGEVLPGEVYREAFAEVRAMAAATNVCAPLLQSWAQGCAVHSAALVDESYDPATQSAEFVVDVVFTLKPEAKPMPDLATRSFRSSYLRLDQADAFATSATPEAFLTYAVEAGVKACATWTANGDPCRVMQMSLEWESPEKAAGHVVIGALGPLPKGVIPAPPLY